MMKKFARKEVYFILALLIVAVAPLLLQKGEVIDPDDADERLVILTAHNETIRREFTEAFVDYYKEKTGKTVYLDWRNPGGSSQIRRLIDGAYKRANDRGDSSIGADILFGGGDYMHRKLSEQGLTVKLDVFKNQPDWFIGKNGIRKTFTGEYCYDAKNRHWVGVCLAQFGICYNVDGIRRIGGEPPTTWDDLGEPRFYGKLALADPTKSGSVARAFELMIQEKIHAELKVVKRRAGESRNQMRQRAIRVGWEKGLQLIQRICANARYFTDSSSKIPRDVAQGDAVAGLCVDFYGRAYNERYRKEDGSSRLVWVAPKGGTSVSVDPISILKGAPNAKLAQTFVEFLLSEKGQLLWNNKVGTKNGPKHRAIRRLPIRPDMYTAERLKDFSDPEALPYESKDHLIYDVKLTGQLFEPLRAILQVMCIDVHDEMKDSWGTLIENSKDGKISPDAKKKFNDVAFFSYQRTMELKGALSLSGLDEEKRKQKHLRTQRLLNRRADYFRRSYKDAEKLSDL